MDFSPRRAPSFRSVAVLVLLIVFAAFAPGSANAAAHRRARHTAVVPAALRSAAARANRADRILVSAARALHSCIRTSNGSCAGSRSAVQSAGHAFSSAERNLALKARRAGRGRAASSSVVQAPTLKASGVKLSWSAIAHASSYVLASEVPGQGDRYAVSHTNSATPPPVPGVTVTYMVRTAERSSHWSNAVKVTYPAAAPTAPTAPAPPAVSVPTQELDMRAAPSLHVSGQTISWNLVAGVSTYVLMTKVTGQAEAFTAVSGSSVTPPAVPGKTVSYSVRTAVDGSAWAPNVTITYPAAPPVTPPVAPSEPSQSIGASEGFQPGINGGTASQDYTGAVILGAKIVRISMPIGVPASALESTVSSYAAKGIRIEPLASFYGRIPSAAEAQNVASWAKAFGPGGTFWAKRSDGNLAIRSIEFGNETSYGYQYGDNAGAPSYTARAQSYAIRFKEAAEAISATGVKVGLLADADDPTGAWMNGMFAAVPNLGSYVGGWISHPYGTGGKSKLTGIINQTAAHGASSSIPIDITEWGLSTDNGDCVTENYGLNPCMSYQEAGEQLKRSVTELKNMLGSRLGLFLLYQVRDQSAPGASKEREAYFGLLQQTDAPKPGYTQAAQELLAL
jgi:hypothetical protein